MMAVLTWAKMFLILIWMLQLRVANGHTLSLFPAGDDDEVTLPCKNAIHAQHECTSTTWFFSGSRNQKAVELVILGKIVEDLQAKSDRLSVSRNCSLVIKKVTVEDVGLYTCRQFNESGLQRGPDFQVHLSVIIMIEHKNNDEVNLYCCVFSYDHCRHRVEWLYEGKEEQPSNIEIKSGYCSTTLTFTSSHVESRFNKSLKCKATNDYNKKEQLFPFRLHSSCVIAAEYGTRTTISVSSNINNEAKQEDPRYLLRYIIVCTSLAGLLITFVTVTTWTKTKGNMNIPQMEENTDCGEDQGDTVTCTTVKTSSSSTGVPTDPRNPL
ncbi:unnamed protein product [Oreochromis niloticus]|nr:unnamed protein product [Mustela putorius furo]